jgi:hypothetical protein
MVLVVIEEVTVVVALIAVVVLVVVSRLLVFRNKIIFMGLSCYVCICPFILHLDALSILTKPCRTLQAH